MTKYFIDDAGNYIGGFDGAEPPIGSIEIETPPDYARSIFKDGAWVFPLEILNAPILAALAVIDAKSIRPLREGDTARVAALESEAAALRLQLHKV